VNGLYIYGNVFYDNMNKGISISANPGTTHNNVKIFNNTLDHMNPGYAMACTPNCTNCETRNNLFNSCGGYASACGTDSNNLVITNDAVFINRATRDYHIVSTIGTGYPRNAGYNVGSPYNTDPDGNMRGADGTWDIGAYEYGGSGDTRTQAPQNLRIFPQ
jgi:hypothetical protein